MCSSHKSLRTSDLKLTVFSVSTEYLSLLENFLELSHVSSFLID